uniref:Uncharacterized protein LOC110216532 n=1 Tax=Phascolarctos cinereus TaxID=38626 RepID=A0A6P5LES5_PHACI|nr:uncharacterized protein LOC110216532 [Phascolarctos cinereus]
MSNVQYIEQPPKYCPGSSKESPLIPGGRGRAVPTEEKAERRPPPTPAPSAGSALQPPGVGGFHMPPLGILPSLKKGAWGTCSGGHKPGGGGGGGGGGGSGSGGQTPGPGPARGLGSGRGARHSAPGFMGHRKGKQIGDPRAPEAAPAAPVVVTVAVAAAAAAGPGGGECTSCRGRGSRLGGGGGGRTRRPRPAALAPVPAPREASGGARPRLGAARRRRRRLPHEAGPGLLALGGGGAGGVGSSLAGPTRSRSPRRAAAHAPPRPPGGGRRAGRRRRRAAAAPRAGRGGRSRWPPGRSLRARVRPLTSARRRGCSGPGRAWLRPASLPPPRPRAWRPSFSPRPHREWLGGWQLGGGVRAGARRGARAADGGTSAASAPRLASGSQGESERVCGVSRRCARTLSVPLPTPPPPGPGVPAPAARTPPPATPPGGAAAKPGAPPAPAPGPPLSACPTRAAGGPFIPL